MIDSIGWRQNRGKGRLVNHKTSSRHGHWSRPWPTSDGNNWRKRLCVGWRRSPSEPPGCVPIAYLHVASL